jgi:hypothetical protein
VQAFTAAVDEREAGTSGKPMLQDGGEQDALTAPDPGNEVVRVQDCRHPELAPTTTGCDAVQVREILLRTMPPLVLGKELLPMMSVMVA